MLDTELILEETSYDSSKVVSIDNLKKQKNSVARFLSSL